MKTIGKSRKLHFAIVVEKTNLTEAVAVFFNNGPQRLLPMRTVASYVDDDPFGFFVIAREFHSGEPFFIELLFDLHRQQLN